MQIYTLLSPCKSIPYYPHGMITPPFPVLPIFTTYSCSYFNCLLNELYLEHNRVALFIFCMMCQGGFELNKHGFVIFKHEKKTAI